MKLDDVIKAQWFLRTRTILGHIFLEKFWKMKLFTDNYQEDILPRRLG